MTHVYLTVHQDSQVVLATPGSAELLLPAMCVVLRCISLIISDVGYLFIYLLAIVISSS